MPQLAPRLPRWRLATPLRKGVLVAHILASIGWVGVDIALWPLLWTAHTSDDPALVAGALHAIGAVMLAAVPALSLLILATGLALGG